LPNSIIEASKREIDPFRWADVETRTAHHRQPLAIAKSSNNLLWIRKRKMSDWSCIAVAARDMGCAKEGFLMISELKCEPGDNRYQPLLFGAVVSYARPFTANDGFGALSAKWSKFPTGELQEAHQEIIDYRNTVAAHSDISTNKLHIYPTGVSLMIGEKSLTLDEPMYAVSTPLLNKSDIVKYISLCEYQRDRMTDVIVAGMEQRFMRRPGLPPVPFEFRHDRIEVDLPAYGNEPLREKSSALDFADLSTKYPISAVRP